ncbi:MAG: Tn3 family transposase [Thiolinea sp.]
MPRMRILTASEQDAFDKPPLFNAEQRKQFFTFPKALLEIAYSLRTPNSQIGFLLLCGYFKATKRFFLPQDFHSRDVEAVSKVLDYPSNDFLPGSYVKTTRQRHQKLILAFYGFTSFDSQSEGMLTIEITTMAKTYLKPKLIFGRCVDFLIQKRIQIPSSRSLSDLIRAGLQTHKEALITSMNNHLNDQTRRLLEDLFTTPDDKNQYRLTLLKKLSQSTKPSKVKESIADFETLSELYGKLDSTISKLNLSYEGIRYYAGSVIRSRMFQLQRREANDRYIHTAAFIAHQFFRLQDNLADILLSVMKTFQNTAIRQHKEQLFEHRKAQNQQLNTVVDELDTSVFRLLREIHHLTDETALSDAEKIIRIKALLDQGKTESFEQLKAGLLQAGQPEVWYEVLEQQSVKLQNRLSPILKALIFEPVGQVDQLMEAIDYFKIKEGAITDKAPADFLEADECKAVISNEGTFRKSLYKVFLFQHVAAAIKSGHLNLRKSYKYRPMDSYIIDKARWERDKTMLLKRAGLTDFTNPKMILKALDTALLQQYQATNTAAASNPYLTFRSDDTFHVKTPAQDTHETNPLQSSFPARHDVPLAQVLDTVDRHCGLLKAFEHWQQTHTPLVVSRPALLAGIMGLGCSIGVRKMGRISSKMTENELEHAVNWRFSLENVRAANDQVLKAMDKMELPNRYLRETDQRHTASDGQKFEIRGESLHASRSFKYFGQGQGVSAYTFVDERHFLWHSLMISASDRESAYVIDGLMHNDVVKSDIHSTDTHGYTEAVFGLTHLLGFSFAPRIKGLGKQTLYIFRSKSQADSKWKIAPDKTINTNLIRENWDDLLRLVATIKLKENTASAIFRRLNSYSRQHALYQTLKAFGQIIKSLFILRYVNEVELRQAIEKQLNKVELANRFTRAVAVGNPREYTQVEKEEQEIAEGCNRLIKNSIICWNYLYLERQLEKMNDPEARDNLLRMIAAHSPMAWAHINLLGEYDFSDEKLQDSVGILPPESLA